MRNTSTCNCPACTSGVPAAVMLDALNTIGGGTASLPAWRGMAPTVAKADPIAVQLAEAVIELWMMEHQVKREIRQAVGTRRTIRQELAASSLRPVRLPDVWTKPIGWEWIGLTHRDRIDTITFIFALTAIVVGLIT